MNILIWIIIVLVVLLVLSATYYYVVQPLIFPSNSTTSPDIKKQITSYTLYNYRYLDNMKSGGTVIASIPKSTTALDCSNRAVLLPKCVGANWYKDTSTCELLSDLLPLSDDSTSTLIVSDASNLQTNKVYLWTPTDGVANDGRLFCSDTLANSTYAKALCASIPECGAYTFELNSDNYPTGCLKVKSSMYPSVTNPSLVTNISTFSGDRTDGIVYNITDNDTNNTNPTCYYRWGTILQNATIVATFNNLTLKASADMLVKQLQTNTQANGNLNIVAQWDTNPTNGGVTLCTLYDVSSGININKNNQTQNSTLILPSSLSSLLRYSNEWTRVNNIDYPNSNQGLALTFKEAMNACVNSTYTAFVLINGFYYLRNQTDPSVATTGAIAYILPTGFV